jgi:hypothetical protein
VVAAVAAKIPCPGPSFP